MANNPIRNLKGMILNLVMLLLDMMPMIGNSLKNHKSFVEVLDGDMGAMDGHIKEVKVKESVIMA